MSTRQPLRQHLTNAWARTIEGAYSQQLITSERGLQVHFCAALTHEFSLAQVERRLFVEPTFVFDAKYTRMPDLVICNSKRIIGVVELKYTPRAAPDVIKDLQTLNLFGSAKGEVSLSCERYRGPEKHMEFQLADDAVLCWAGVYADTLLDLPAAEVGGLGNRFLRLDAVTHERKEPTITSNGAAARER